MSKFLILWSLEPSLVNSETVKAIFKMPQYAQQLLQSNKLIYRYHLVGQHGGAWIYDVASNEELDRLLAMSPVYNFAKYQIYPLAEMVDPAIVSKMVETTV